MSDKLYTAAEVDRLRGLLANCYNWRTDPPCQICGYNGPDYFDGTVHECAAIYHLSQYPDKEASRAV
jgi:hypothetical protein